MVMVAGIFSGAGTLVALFAGGISCLIGVSHEFGYTLNRGGSNKHFLGGGRDFVSVLVPAGDDHNFGIGGVTEYCFGG